MSKLAQEREEQEQDHALRRMYLDRVARMSVSLASQIVLPPASSWHMPEMPGDGAGKRRMYRY